MSAGFALRLRLEDGASLGPLRLTPGLEVCQHGADLWLRGSADAVLAARLDRLPALRRYQLTSDGLRPAGARLPCATLPPGPWRPLAEALPFAPQRPTPSGVQLEALPLRLGPAREERAASVLKTSLAEFAAWADTAPAVRLRGLRFAADDRGQVLVRGAVLPPLPGVRCWEDAGLVVPCGRTWTPALPASLAAEALDLLPGELALLSEDGFERVPERAFVSARRSAVRATAEAER